MAFKETQFWLAIFHVVMIVTSLVGFLKEAFFLVLRCKLPLLVDFASSYFKEKLWFISYTYFLIHFRDIPVKSNNYLHSIFVPTLFLSILRRIVEKDEDSELEMNSGSFK